MKRKKKVVKKKDLIIQEQNNATEERAKELLTQYFGTDDADIQLINASDLFKEFGLRVKP